MSDSRKFFKKKDTKKDDEVKLVIPTQIKRQHVCWVLEAWEHIKKGKYIEKGWKIALGDADAKELDCEDVDVEVVDFLEN